jgi:sulfur carrier protein ThiS
MKVTLKLFATLTRFLPAQARASSRVELELAAGGTALDLIRQQGLPLDQCTMVLVDGVFLAREELAKRALAEGEVVAIWPPVGGG